VFHEVSVKEFKRYQECLQINYLDHQPRDRFGVQRDAVGFKDSCRVDVYEAAWKAIPAIEERYVFAFHEILGMMDLEMGSDRNNPSNYRLSSKIVRYVVKRLSHDLRDFDSEMRLQQEFAVFCNKETNQDGFKMPDLMLHLRFTYESWRLPEAKLFIQYQVGQGAGQLSYIGSQDFIPRSLNEDEINRNFVTTKGWYRTGIDFKVSSILPEEKVYSFQLKFDLVSVAKEALHLQSSLPKTNASWFGRAQLTGKDWQTGIGVVCATYRRVGDDQYAVASQEDLELLQVLLNQ
jgi:hypothetical protein